MAKYTPLKEFLEQQGADSVPMTFAQIEKLVDRKLPPSARRHRPWWSNNPSNSVMTRAWLAAGYKTEQVDMEGERLVFRRQRDLPQPGEGFAEAASHRSLSGQDYLDAISGCMKGTIRIAEGTDLTQPLSVTWNAEVGNL